VGAVGGDRGETCRKDKLGEESMFGICKKGKNTRNVLDRAETGAGYKMKMGAWESQGWHRKEMAILRAVGVLTGSHMGTEMSSSAEGGVKVIKELKEKLEWCEEVRNVLGWR
jgi:hypothetical protein